jgi:hypothetical protein
MDTGDWIGLVQAIVALLAVGVAIFYSRRSLHQATETSRRTLHLAEQQLEQATRTSDETLALTRAQLRQDAEHSFHIAGGDRATNWRRQVMDWHELGLTADEIRAVLLTEDGVEWNADGKALNIEDNGSIDALLKALDSAERRRKGRSSQT